MHNALKWLPVAGACLWLGACSSIGNIPPDQMLRQAMQHNLTRDNQYHFEGKMALEPVPPTHNASDVGSANTPPALAAAPDSAPSALTDAVSAAPQPMATDPDTPTAPSDQEADNRSNWAHYWLRHTDIPFSGTVDLAQAKIEMIPELRYQTRQSLLSAKVPLQIDVRQLALVADVDALLPIIATANGSQTFKQMDGRLLRLQAPPSWRKPHVINSIWQAFPQALDAGYAALDKQAFQALPLDDMGRQVRARHRVRLTLNLAQNQQMMAATLASLTQQIQQTAQADQAQKEDYATPLALLKLGKEMTNLHNMTAFVLERNFGQYHTDYYLDRRGRIVAMRQEMPFPELLNRMAGGQNQRWQMVTRIQLHYTRQPRFTLQPTANNTVALEQLFPGIRDWLSTSAAEP